MKQKMPHKMTLTYYVVVVVMQAISNITLVDNPTEQKG